MGIGTSIRCLLTAAMLIVGVFAGAREARGQLFNPLRVDDDRAIQQSNHTVRLPGDVSRSSHWLRQNDPSQLSDQRSVLDPVSAEESQLNIAPPVSPSTDEPQLDLPPLNPGVDDAPLHWPDDDYNSDPNLPGPIRQRMAKLNRLLRIWTGIGADRSERYIGLGDPLTNTSWLNRPWSFGAFIGMQTHDELVENRVAQSNSAIGGMRLGLDFDYYWGLEMRYGYSNPHLYVPGVRTDLGSSHNYFVDLAVMYYPWGDSRWRPYFSAGLGSATYRYSQGTIHVSDSSLHVPLGIGLKYFYAPWLTLRFDAEYALAFGNNNTNLQNEFMIGVGAEIRFGGTRTSYYPWSGNAAYW